MTQTTNGPSQTLIHGFVLEKEQQLPELNILAQLYRHQKSGARLLSLQNDDENKVFGITFRTPPTDSTGVAHILEHAVLGGSRKYRAKEPFVELVKGSLKTFVNAFTYPDRTCYPVASTNMKDFYNLVDVYLDAVFYPLITRHHLEQEGWHYELEKLGDPLNYKGVVFNEMKGAYSSADGAFARYSDRSLFPDMTYGLDSGGDPKAIPDLTYEQFTDFHKRYYHPSNSYIFFYGDDDPSERLRLLDAWLHDFSTAAVDSTVPLQSAWSAPQRFTYHYSVDENGASGGASEHENKGKIRMNWLLPEGNDPELDMELSVLSYAMLGTPASPMRKTLLDSGLGEDTIGGGLSTTLRQMTFSVGMNGVAAENLSAVESLIMDTLTKLANEGFEQEMIEAALNTIEFHLRENNTGSYPRGLLLMLTALSTWIYDGDPFEPLMYEGPLAAVKQKLTTHPQRLQELIQTYLLQNSHRSTTIMTPQTGLNAQEEAAEKARLEGARLAMSEAELLAVIENTKALKARQSAPDSAEVLAAIPRLTLSDLDQQGVEIPIEVGSLNGAPLLYHDLFTNGIVYLNVGFDMQVLPADLLPYVKLFGRALTEIGTETEDTVKLTQRIKRKTGGIWSSTLVSSLPVYNNPPAERLASPAVGAWFFLNGKSTPEQAAEMLAIMTDLVRTVKLDNREKFRQMVLEAKSGRESGLIPSGHGVAGGRLRSQLTIAGWVGEQMGGIDNLFFLRKLATEIENDWPGVLQKLEEVRRLLLNRNSVFCNVTLDADNWSRFEPQLANFVATLPAVEAPRLPWRPVLQPLDEGLTLPAQVNYVALGGSLYKLGYELHGSVSPITGYLRTTWLWDQVRVQGGAYGAFCQFSKNSGSLSFLSYRDPNLLNTVKVYQQSADYLRTLNLDEGELTKSIIGAISSIDSYQLPDAKGYTSMVRHLMGESAEQRQLYRQQVLSTTVADFKRFADFVEQVGQQGALVVLGSPDAIEKANQQGDRQMQVVKVM